MKIRRFTILAAACFIFVVLLQQPTIPSRAQTIPALPAQTLSGWTIECVDCPKSFLYISDRGLQIDANGHSHIAYGGDHLYYAWHDGAEWQYETVDAAPGTGGAFPYGFGASALVLDGSDNPHISYYDSVNGDLKYAYRDIAGWHIQTVDSLDDVGMSTSLALDASGYPHVSYYDFTNQDLKYAYFDGSAWQIEMVDSSGDVGSYNSIALDSNGFSHISYYDATQDRPKYAYWTGAAWDIQTLNSYDSGMYPSIAIDCSDLPHISFYYHQGSSYNLIYAHWTGSTWDIQEVDPDNYSGRFTSIVLDSSDHPLIATQTIQGRLKYFAWNGSSWDIQTVDSSGDVFYSVSLALDSADTPRIAYLYQNYSTPQHSIRQASWNGSTWDFETVDTASETSGQTSLALDELGNPHVAYRSGVFVLGMPAANLSYARWDGSNWDIQTVDGGGNVTALSMAIEANGTPHIAYYDDGLDVIRYAHWTGSSWDIQTVGPGSGYVSIALDGSGYPHLAYSNNGLYHVYWDGSAWVSQVVDVSGGFIGESSLSLDSQGYAQISYCQNHNIMYAYWDGGGWSIQTVEYNIGSYTAQPSLALDSLDNPHISYYYGYPNGVLKYATWSGGPWDIQVVDSGGDIGRDSSIAVDSLDRPHISYNDNTNLDLKYASWDGNSWITQTVVSAGYVGHFNSLALDAADNPHISYLDETTRDIMLAHYAGEPVAPQSVDLSGPDNGDVMNSLTFTATVSPISTTIPIQYVWEATGQSPITQTGGLVNTTSFTWDAPGTQVITVTATNAYGQVSDSHTVTLAEVPISGLTASNDSPTTLGEVTTLTATVSTGTNITYAWDFGDGAAGTGATVTHTYPDLGLYTATVTATNSLGSETDFTMVTITDVPIAGLTAANDSPTTLGEVTALTATISAGTNITFAWDFGDGSMGAGAEVEHTYTDVGLFTATVTATNSLGSEEATTLVSITDVPIAGLSAVNDSPNLLGEATTFTATVTAGSNVIYSWDFGDGTSRSGAVVTHTYTAVGDFTATVTASNGVGSASITTLVTILPVGPANRVFLPVVMKN